MFRRLLIAIVLTSGLVLVGSADAGIKISRNNPYRSFNTSGVNYGSMQWERTHPYNPFPNQNYRYRSAYRAYNR